MLIAFSNKLSSCQGPWNFQLYIYHLYIIVRIVFITTESGLNRKGLECGSVCWNTSHKLKVTGSVPGQHTYLGCRFNTGTGCIKEATNRCFCLTSMFHSLSVPFFPPLSKINKHVLRWGFKKKDYSVGYGTVVKAREPRLRPSFWEAWSKETTANAASATTNAGCFCWHWCQELKCCWYQGHSRSRNSTMQPLPPSKAIPKSIHLS